MDRRNGHAHGHARKPPATFPSHLFALWPLICTAALVVACGDGEPRLVFDSERDGDDDIYLMSPDGSNVQQLTNDPGRDYEPDAAPNGKTIVFASQRAGGESAQLHLMDIDGSNVRRLTFSAEGAANRVLDNYAEWSPDGKRIAFQRTIIPEGGKASADIWLINPGDGRGNPVDGHPGNLGQHAQLHRRRPRRHLRKQPHRHLRALQAAVAGGDAVRITEREGIEAEAKESPDGRQIAFVSDQDGDFDVYLMDAGGGNIRAITSSEGNDRCPQWSPDGKRIAFSSERDGNPEIYVMNADGSDQRRLTETAEPEEVADWVR